LTGISASGPPPNRDGSGEPQIPRAFVEALATRIASFDKLAISETKHFVDVASLPPDFEIAPEWDVCFASIGIH
jgi:hypothetical protein